MAGLSSNTALRRPTLTVTRSAAAGLVALLLASCSGEAPNNSTAAANTTLASGVAPGAPGTAPTWAYAGKTGIGTSYEAYVDGHYADTASTGVVSKVWFSIAQGIVTETMSGLIHQAQIKDMQFYVLGHDFLHDERSDTDHQVLYVHTDAEGRPLSLAYRLINRDRQDRYRIEKTIFTDPDRQSLVMQVKFVANVDGLTPVLTINPHLANTGSNDRAWLDSEALYAQDGDKTLAVFIDKPFAQRLVGFVGQSDGVTDLRDLKLDWQYQTTGEQTGNVALTASLGELMKGEHQFTVVLGFGDSQAQAKAQAQGTLAQGANQVLAKFNGEGDAIGWQDYIASLPALPQLAATATDGGKLAYASAMVLKAQEDKTHAGALIASLSNPWGDIKSAQTSQTGYKAVWPRDFYQTAMAFLAMGDTQTPKVAFSYLKQVQVNAQTPGYQGAYGWFLQKTHVDGQLEWVGVQLDQTAMPVMLGWKLWQQQLLNADELRHWYQTMLKPAADFLVDGGKVKLDWNDSQITSPFTQQERWEEQQGYSPSTTAAVITGLVSAADIATALADNASASRYLAAADSMAASLEHDTFTTSGNLGKQTKAAQGNATNGDGTANDVTQAANGQYYLRITQNTDPNDQGKLDDRNGQGEINESDVVDGGFLELVRFGVRSADHPAIRDTLGELDDQSLPDALRVKYEFSFPGVAGQFPGWRRYGLDGYGEDTQTGLGYAAGDVNHAPQRGRVWPFFTGERGHYELAYALASGAVQHEKLDKLRHTYIKGMELFANDGLMLPEQVWDGVGNNDVYQYTLGEGTNAATPLAWTHAEYIKLLRSFADQKVWDNYPSVTQRYQAH